MLITQAIIGDYDTSYVYDRLTTTVDISNSNTETTIYTATIAAGVMRSNRMLRLTLLGDFLHNVASTDTFTIRFKFGGTTFMAADFGGDFGNSTNANRQAWRVVAEIMNLGVANSQMMAAVAHAIRPSAGAGVTGIGSIKDSANTAGIVGCLGISTLGTIDTTAAQTLEVTGQWDVIQANDSFRTRCGVLELV